MEEKKEKALLVGLNITSTARKIDDIDINKVTKDMFVCFYTGFIEEEGYGTKNILRNILRFPMNYLKHFCRKMCLSLVWILLA